MISNYFVSFHLKFVGNKAKGRISKRVFQEDKAPQISPGGRKYLFFPKIWRALFSWKHLFSHSSFCVITDEFESGIVKVSVRRVVKSLSRRSTLREQNLTCASDRASNKVDIRNQSSRPRYNWKHYFLFFITLTSITAFIFNMFPSNLYAVRLL